MPTRLKMQRESISGLFIKYFYIHPFLHFPFQVNDVVGRDEWVLGSSAAIEESRPRASMLSAYPWVVIAYVLYLISFPLLFAYP